MIPWSVGLSLIFALIIGFVLWGVVYLPAQSAKRQLRAATAAKFRAAAIPPRDAVFDGLITYEQVARWLSPEVRAALDGPGRSDDVIRHGTEAGFQRHFARPELACPTCLSAHHAYMRQRSVARNRK